MGLIMGLFDYIRVDLLLPNQLNIIESSFQTKSFDNQMAQYVITQKGELYKEHWDYIWIDDDNEFFKGHLEAIPETYRRDYLTNYCGEIIFYNDSIDGKWIDYHALFINGKLNKIEVTYGQV